VYTSDGNFAGSSGSTTEKVKAATTLSLTSSNPSLIYGDSVTLQATLSSTAGTPPDGEKITFKNGTATVGTGVLAGDVATLTTSTLPVGSLTLTAVYAGDIQYLPVTSASITETVTKASTSITVTSSQSGPGQPVTLTASVQPTTGTAVPTGTVTFKDGTKLLGLSKLSGGTSSINVTLTAGSHTIQASYGGSTNLNGSSASSSVVVQ
jgi:hypothetical protein